MKHLGVFIDLDGTLYRNSLMLEHFKKLLKYEIIDPAIWHNIVKDVYQDWDKRRGNFEDYLLEVAEIYLKSMKGLNKQEMEFINTQIIELKGDRVYRYTRDRIEWHKKMGHKVFFISGSPDYLVSKMAEKYGATDYRATTYIVDDEGNFTGEISPMWDSENKHKSIKDLVEKYDIDLKESYAYGDTQGDFAMLKQVGNPVAINPASELLFNIKRDEELAKIATIIIERKDVIYKLTANVEVIN
ncbi:HAD family hydrolase [Alkaliphilus hydrothermalis]|nr:HAD-IB family hydrolase [Alkaliphilus hydrothermalis]